MRWRVSRPPCSRAQCPSRAAPARRCTRLRAGRGRDGADRRAAVRPLQCRWLCGAFRRSRFRRRGVAGPRDAERRGDRLRHRADTAGLVGNGHADRNRRPGAARGGRHRHGRTYPAGRGLARSKSAAPLRPGQFVSYAGSDIARGEALLRAGTIIGSREIGMLAACGIAQVSVARRPRVAIISTGDELVQPGQPLRPAAIYDTNGAIVTAAISENGGEARFFRRHSRRRSATRIRDAQGAAKPATCWCCRAAPPRAPATSPIASSAGSANPASSRMAWR